MDSRDNNIRNNRADNKHLHRLGDLSDYKVASDDPDVRGWKIVDRDNREFGTINELIVDVDKERVRYLDVVPTGTLEDRKEGDEHLLLPIGIASLDGNSDRVIMNDVDIDRMKGYPPHTGDVVTRDYEYSVVERLNKPDGPGTGSTAPGPTSEQDFYANRLYDEDRFYTNRTRNRPL